MTELAAELFLYFQGSWEQIYAMKPSDARALFASKAFASWKKGRENEHKIASAIIDRIDGVAKRIDSLGKVLAKRN